VRDARLRECDYGKLTRRPVCDIEAERAAHIATPFPDGESYATTRASPADGERRPPPPNDPAAARRLSHPQRVPIVRPI
jgi:hypothetical protein